MGLLNERGSRLDQPSAAQDVDEDEEVEGDYQDGDDYEEIEHALADATGAVLGGEGSATPEPEANHYVEMDADSEVLPLHPQKRARRTKDLLPSPPISNESTALEKDQAVSTGVESVTEASAPKRSRGRPRKSQHSADADGQAANASKTATSTAQKGKKRKASESPPAALGLPGSTEDTHSKAGGRVKRIASTAKSVVSYAQDEPDHVAGASTRSTRGKKR